MENQCIICHKQLITSSIKCSVCACKFHKKCANLSSKELRYYESNDTNWMCMKCLTNLFPFNNLENFEFECCINLNINESLYEKYEKCTYLNFKPFKYNDCNNNNEHDLDPENNFFNNLNVNSQYYTDDQFNANFSSGTAFKLIHFNCRSLKANFDNIQVYLQPFLFPQTLKGYFSSVHGN